MYNVPFIKKLSLIQSKIQNSDDRAKKKDSIKKQDTPHTHTVMKKQTNKQTTKTKQKKNNNNNNNKKQQQQKQKQTENKPEFSQKPLRLLVLYNTVQETWNQSIIKQYKRDIIKPVHCTWHTGIIR